MMVVNCQVALQDIHNLVLQTICPKVEIFRSDVLEFPRDSFPSGCVKVDLNPDSLNPENLEVKVGEEAIFWKPIDQFRL